MLLTEDEAKTKQCRVGGMTPVFAETMIGRALVDAPTMLGGCRFGPIQWPTCAASGNRKRVVPPSLHFDALMTAEGWRALV